MVKCVDDARHSTQRVRRCVGVAARSAAHGERGRRRALTPRRSSRSGGVSELVAVGVVRAVGIVCVGAAAPRAGAALRCRRSAERGGGGEPRRSADALVEDEDDHEDEHQRTERPVVHTLLAEKERHGVGGHRT